LYAVVQVFCGEGTLNSKSILTQGNLTPRWSYVITVSLRKVWSLVLDKLLLNDKIIMAKVHLLINSILAAKNRHFVVSLRKIVFRIVSWLTL
jgi:hypothetical protein